MNPIVKLAVDLGPLVVFFAAYARAGIMAATAAFMVATVAALGAAYALERRLAVVPLATGVVVLFFGGLTLVLADELFIKLKPTVVYALFAGVLFGGLAFKRPLLKPLFEMAFRLDERGWLVLTRRWGWFFLAMAALNEIVRRGFSTDAWVALKVFGFLPLTFLFAATQLPFIRRHRAPAEDGP
jgi:intracellular septation protein